MALIIQGGPYILILFELTILFVKSELKFSETCHSSIQVMQFHSMYESYVCMTYIEGLGN